MMRMRWRIDENPGEELDILCQSLALLPNQALQEHDGQGDVDVGGGGVHHLDEDELEESGAGVVEDWEEPPVQVGRVTHFRGVTGNQISIPMILATFLYLYA